MLEEGCSDISPFPKVWRMDGAHARRSQALEGGIDVLNLKADVQELGLTV